VSVLNSCEDVARLCETRRTNVRTAPLGELHDPGADLVRREAHPREGPIDVERGGRVPGPGDLNVQKARILLMLALTKTQERAEVAKIFNEFNGAEP